MPTSPLAGFRYRKSELAWIGQLPLASLSALTSKRGSRSKAKVADLSIRVPARVKEEPSEPQINTYQHLMKSEEMVAKKVLDAILESFRYYSGPSSWMSEHYSHIKTLEELLASGLVSLLAIEITRQHRESYSYLVFHLDADWEVEHGMYIVYSPHARKAEWCTADSLYDLTESDEEVGELEEQSPWQQLIDSIYYGESKTITKLLKAGVDINMVPKGETPPLVEAVENMNTQHIKLFLKYGADPHAVCKEFRSTPYKMAIKVRNEYGFSGATGRQDSMMREMMSLMKGASGGAFGKLEREWNEAIELMKPARGKKGK
jgi:hypothetical protein